MYNFTIYTTMDCNFQCKYCYEDYKEHYNLDKRILAETLEFIFHYGNRDKILLSFLGGEPLLKKDLIYEAVDYIKSHYPNREVKYYITTNCSLADREFIAFMKENDFSVRLSFDGNERTHNLNRIPKDGLFCYGKILENILQVKNSGLHFSVRMTVTQNTIPFMFENIQFLHKQGLSHINMIMDIYLELSEELREQFETQVEQITDYYIKEYDQGSKIIIDQFDGKIFNFLCNSGNCFAMCDAGISNFKILPDGNIYPCGFLTNDSKFAVGNIHKGIDIRKAKEIAYMHYDRDDNKCGGCNIRYFCHGMKCGYMNYLRTGRINIPSEEECQCEKIFYRSMTRLMNHYLAQPKEKLQKTLGEYMDLIKRENMQLSEYGEKVKMRLKDGEQKIIL